jgi:hypothetical protein
MKLIGDVFNKWMNSMEEEQKRDQCQTQKSPQMYREEEEETLRDHGPGQPWQPRCT